MSSSDDRASPLPPPGDPVPIRDDAALATSVAFPGGDDGIDDWLGCESCHPLTWLPAASDRRF